MKNKAWIIFLIIALLGIFTVNKYNALVNAEESVNSKWAQVENNLQRRADLISNLVNTVKGFAKQEQDVLKGVVEARNGYENAKSPSEYADAEAKLKSSINIVVEAYPELKSDKNFIALQDELAGTENRLAVARKDYNEEVERFNKYVRRFPNNIFAKILGADKKEYFQIDDSSKSTPKVNF